MHATRQLVCFWKEQKSSTEKNQATKVIERYLRSEIFPGIEVTLANQVARLLAQAVNVCDRAIPNGVRNRLLQGNVNCYICGRTLDPDAKPNSLDIDAKDDIYPTLEHLWPTSLGGESEIDNLLPACKLCQNRKADAFSWEWFNIHNTVLPSQPKTALEHLPWPIRIARHQHHAMELCELEHISLKSAFIRIGSIKIPLTCGYTGRPITFFDLQTQRL